MCQSLCVCVYGCMYMCMDLHVCEWMGDCKVILNKCMYMDMACLPAIVLGWIECTCTWMESMCVAEWNVFVCGWMLVKHCPMNVCV